MQLDDSLRNLAEELGADFFGVADLSLARDSIISQGGLKVEGYPKAVSIGIALLNPIVDQPPNRAKMAVAIEYRHHAYDVINERLDSIASRLGNVLQNEGYRAYPVPASKRADDERIYAIFSHKLAAHLAGLGWIGKSCLLITPTAGPRVRLATLLTDAPLKPTGQSMQERCEDCLECMQVCPVGDTSPSDPSGKMSRGNLGTTLASARATIRVWRENWASACAECACTCAHTAAIESNSLTAQSCSRAPLS